MDSRRRSMTKAITWGIPTLLITTIVCFAILGNWSASIAVGILSTLLEAVFYYVDDRLRS